MAEIVETTLCSILRTAEFSIQLDESTLPGNESFLLAYVPMIKDENANQDLLFARQLETNTTGAAIFAVITEQFFKEINISFTNILSCATDGAPSMIGRYRGFVSYLKKVVPNVTSVHCVIHRQHQAAKHFSDQLQDSLKTVINL
jgi:hypothetical protein